MRKFAFCMVAAVLVVASGAAVAANNGKPWAEGHAPAGSRAAFSSGPQAFPKSTTIYIVPNVRDNGGATNVGIATIIGCTNVSGVSATVRFLALDLTGL